MNRSRNPLFVVLSQVRAAKSQLESYPPEGFGWFARSNETANLLVPWLVSVAADLKTYVEEVVNARGNVRRVWGDIKTKCVAALPRSLVDLLDEQLGRESVLLSHVGGDIISRVIEEYLIKHFASGKLESNGKSDYPDLFLRSRSYEGLPKFRRNVTEYGAALKGNSRPVRVPDGLEIKTCRDRFAVDCHYPHIGLHLAIVHHEKSEETVVDDVMVAFMQKNDYRITKPKTGATTLKASFNGESFVSLL